MTNRTAAGGVSRAAAFLGCLTISAMPALSLGSESVEVSRASEISIPAGDLEAALKVLARQTGIQLLYDTKVVQGVQTRGVESATSTEDAIAKLLEGTSLTTSTDSSGAILIGVPGARTLSRVEGDGRQVGMRVAQAKTATGSSAKEREQQEAPRGEGEKDEGVQLEEIVVTGTHIRGNTKRSSPLSVYSRAEVLESGASTLEQFVARLPSNLNSLPGVAPGGSFGATANTDAAVGVNLRGLGDGTTLVLLNGRRIAPASQAASPDISLIPLSAIDRVEVLTDGASAIYGADAVGGVVNFVLDRHRPGIETTLELGSSTHSDPTQLRVEQSIGRDWDSGGGLLALSYLDRSGLDAGDRSFARSAAPYSLLPDDERKTAFLTAEQELAGVTLSADVLYTRRKTDGVFAFAIFDTTDARETTEDQLFLNSAARKALSDSVSLTLAGSYSAFEFDYATRRVSGGAPSQLSGGNDTSNFDFTATLDGSLFELPAGELEFALGAGYSEDAYKVVGGSRSQRETNYLFGELSIPLVESLTLSLAARYTDYSDFGSKTSPLVGLSWVLVESLKLRGTYGESYRAPSLFQTDPANSSYAIFPLALFGFPDIWRPDGSTVLLQVSGSGNPALVAETADSWTAGFDLTPGRGLRISSTYFRIKYTDRIAEPDSTGGIAALLSPDDFPMMFTVDPSAEQVASVIDGTLFSINLSPADPFDPASIAGVANVILDNRAINLASSLVKGVDLSVDYTFPRGANKYHLGTEATYFSTYEKQVFSTQPVVSVVDTLLNPVDLRVRAFFGIETGGFGGQLNLNYVDGYSNPLTIGAPKVDNWITADLSLRYTWAQQGNAGAAGSSVLLTVQNVLDEDPPSVPVGTSFNETLNTPIGFDPVNASPIGRLISFSYTRKW